jgi:uncharacterized protein
MISTAEVARLAHRLGVGDRVIEKDYVLSWLLVAIAESDLRGKLAFKGGTALKRCYYPDYRFSEDLDFTLHVDLPHDDLIGAFGAVFPWLSRQANITLTIGSAEQSTLGSTALFIDYVGPLRARPGSRHLKVDVTRGELLLYPLSERKLVAPYSDYPADAALSVYTLEEILTEKLCALMGRTEPRDLYDVYSLFEQGDLDLQLVPEGFAAKSKHKGQNSSGLDRALTNKAETFERLWESRLAVQVQDLPHANDVLRTVRRHLRGLGLI